MAKKNIILLICSFTFVLIGITFIDLTQARTQEYQLKVQEQNQDKANKQEKIVESTTTSTALTYRIDDRTTTCEERLESIYENDEYYYYLPCVKSNTIFIVYSNGNEFTLNYALEKKMVTIEELMDKGLEVIKESKNNISEGN